VIETITARSMAAAVRDLFGPDRLGLVHTWFETLESVPRDAVGERRRPPEPPPDALMPI
jgi:hypothetical protein